MNIRSINRRSFIAAGGAAVAAAGMVASVAAVPPPNKRLQIYIFSKHLQWLDYEDCAKTAKEIGYEGVEVTLRRGGHVLPERVEDDLPRFVEACKKQGLLIDHAATNIQDAGNPLDQRVLRAMAKNGFKSFRLNGWNYDPNKGVQQQLDEIKPALKDIVAACKELGLVAAYQNHSGSRAVGACAWDIYELIRALDQRHVGFSYDIGHATIEGGMSWTTDTRLALPLAKSLVIKDFLWEKAERGWRSQWCVLGTGMINAGEFLKMVAASAYSGPIMMHFEYPTDGNTHDNWYRNHINAQKKDIGTLQQWLRQANLA